MLKLYLIDMLMHTEEAIKLSDFVSMANDNVLSRSRGRRSRRV
jgi:hypothetical protein